MYAGVNRAAPRPEIDINLIKRQKPPVLPSAATPPMPPLATQGGIPEEEVTAVSICDAGDAGDNGDMHMDMDVIPEEAPFVPPHLAD